MHNQDELLNYLKTKKGKSIQLYCDIETLTCNKIEGKKHASKYHSYTYSLAIAWFNEKEDFPQVAIFNNFVDFLTKVKEKKIRKGLTFEMIFHNGEKFDNHFMLFELENYFNCQVKTLFNKSCNNEYNDDAVKPSDLTPEDKEGTILESRIKSSNSVSLTCFLHGRKIELVDSFKKMNTSIKVLGNMLLNNHYIEEQYLKTDFDYACFDKQEDIETEAVLPYVKRCFENLNEEQLIYIRNDVIILALGVKHYKELFYGFDFSKMTFTQNIKEEYSTYNKLAEFQLLKTDGRFSHLVLNDYSICGLTGFDYFRRYYKGGLNLYNDAYVGKLIEREGFSIDLNSSYPTVMYKEKLPTYLISVLEKPKTITMEYKDNDVMTFFSMTYQDANEHVLKHIKSRVLRQAIVKYYNPKNGLVYYNTIMLRLLEKITKHEFKSLPIQSMAVFKCEYFGARDVIAQNYFIKTQGKMKNALDCTMNTINPLNIKMTDKPKPEKYNFSSEQVSGAKVLLNGIYGVPALRVHFDAFHRVNNEYVNCKNGFINKERNIVFSAGVTAYAFHNLLEPLKYLTPEEIDEYFWYADTDSLYMDKRALAKFPKHMFHSMNLGAWDIEHENITKFYAFNHKKYCLYDNEIIVRCGGVSKNLIKEWISSCHNNIELFIKLYFADATTIPSTRSIRNELNTISIYEGQATLEKGSNYLEWYSSEYEHKRQEEIIKFRDEIIQGEALYGEGKYGSIGSNDVIEDEQPNTSNTIQDLLNDYKSYMKKLG